jgi:thiamine pyrophosphate-dependent acetolactate synthase large subunit-like protein
VLPHNPDFQTLAASFGCKTYQPNSIKALQENIKDAVEFRGVSFIEMAQHKVFSTEIN